MLTPGQNLPGIDTAIETTENEFLFGPQGSWVLQGIQLDSTAVDTGSPTTLLRKGLVLAQLTASGNFVDYDPTASDGSQEPIGILYDSVNMLDPRTGSVRAKSGQMVYMGHLKTGSLYGFDEYARVRLGNRFIWDDFRFPHLPFGGTTAKTADYTVLSTDNGKAFTNKGASATVTFTLPTVARGYRFRFMVEADYTVTVAAAANKLVTYNNATATSVSFSTSGQKVGASVEIVSNSDGSKFIAIPSGSNTLTVA